MIDLILLIVPCVILIVYALTAPQTWEIVDWVKGLFKKEINPFDLISSFRILTVAEVEELEVDEYYKIIYREMCEGKSPDENVILIELKDGKTFIITPNK